MLLFFLSHKRGRRSQGSRGLPNGLWNELLKQLIIVRRGSYWKRSNTQLFLLQDGGGEGEIFLLKRGKTNELYPLPEGEGDARRSKTGAQRTTGDGDSLLRESKRSKLPSSVLGKARLDIPVCIPSLAANETLERADPEGLAQHSFFEGPLPDGVPSAGAASELYSLLLWLRRKRGATNRATRGRSRDRSTRYGLAGEPAKDPVHECHRRHRHRNNLLVVELQLSDPHYTEEIAGALEGEGTLTTSLDSLEVGDEGNFEVALCL